MPRVEFVCDTSLTPDQVLELLTDFSDQRPERWPALGPDTYEVYSVGDKTADAREGNASPKVWAREHYDWSQPGVVRWTSQESNFSRPGSYVEVAVRPGKGGGSRVEVTWDKRPSTIFGFIIMTIVKLTGGAPVRSQLEAGFRKAEAARRT